MFVYMKLCSVSYSHRWNRSLGGMFTGFYVSLVGVVRISVYLFFQSANLEGDELKMFIPGN